MKRKILGLLKDHKHLAILGAGLVLTLVLFLALKPIILPLIAWLIFFFMLTFGLIGNG